MRLLLKAGFANIDDLGDMLLKNVHTSAPPSPSSRTPVAESALAAPWFVVCRLKGFVWWVKDHQCHDQDDEVAD
jgi:hypothetical protein